MNNTAKAVVDKIFSAFSKGDVEKFLETVSADTVWIYHGAKIIPKSRHEGVEGAREFITGILNSSDILNFEPQEFICEGNKVVVSGREHQRVKRSGKERKQDWVQIYTVENNLITRMEEFATSEVVE